jgi:hypothetical protein
MSTATLTAESTVEEASSVARAGPAAEVESVAAAPTVRAEKLLCLESLEVMANLWYALRLIRVLCNVMWELWQVIFEGWPKNADIFPKKISIFDETGQFVAIQV